jgi:hypothetical protein
MPENPLPLQPTAISGAALLGLALERTQKLIAIAAGAISLSPCTLIHV